MAKFRIDVDAVRKYLKEYSPNDVEDFDSLVNQSAIEPD